MRTQLIVVMVISLLQLTSAAYPYVSGYPSDAERNVKRSLPLEPEWNQLGWAWGKRSVGTLDIPRRNVRALHPVKKNPDWQDLGFAWGRK